MSSLDLRSLPDRVADILRERIVAGEVAPGQPIRQDALASELGVSKIPLREAMARLEQEGLLRSEANRGFFATPLSAEEAHEVFGLRLKLEPDLAIRAAGLATDGERGEASRLLDRLDRATEADDPGVAMLNRAFHLALVRPAQQPVTFFIVERLHVMSERYARKHLEPLGRHARAADEHRALLDAWCARDDTQIARLMRAHIQHALDDLEGQLTAGQ